MIYKEINNLIKELNSNQDKTKPYLEELILIKDMKYNPEYGDDRICKCGHSYYRHFDSYENMENVGCKYCSCYNFEEDDSRKK